MDSQDTKNEEEIDNTDLCSLEEGECPKSPDPTESDSSTDLTDFMSPTSQKLNYLMDDFVFPTVVVSEIKPLGSLRITNYEDKVFASVDGISGVSPLDEDSVLLIDRQTPLGRVRELIGPVERPCYLVNLCEQALLLVKEGSLTSGEEIFFVPGDGRLTNYVFDVHRLKETQGSDASWIANAEPPQECLDYSDDEKERYGKFEAAQMKKGLTKDEIRRLYDEKSHSRKQRRKPNYPKMSYPPVWPLSYPVMNGQRLPFFPPNNGRYYPYCYSYRQNGGPHYPHNGSNPPY